MPSEPPSKTPPNRQPIKKTGRQIVAKVKVTSIVSDNLMIVATIPETTRPLLDLCTFLQKAYETVAINFVPGEVNLAILCGGCASRKTI